MNFEYIDDYPAKMNPDFARDMIKLYSKEGDLVYDGTCGSGVTIREAFKLGRRAIGTDINPKAIDLCKRHQEPLSQLYRHLLPPLYVEADVKTFEIPEKADLIVCSFPFGNSIGGDKNNYSDEVEDMSNSLTFEEFFVKIRSAIQNYWNNLKPNGIMVLDGRDRTKESRYFALTHEFWKIAKEIGFKDLAQYHIFLMPWSHYTFFNKESKGIVPMVSTLDAIVMYKPKQTSLNI